MRRRLKRKPKGKEPTPPISRRIIIRLVLIILIASVLGLALSTTCKSGHRTSRYNQWYPGKPPWID